MLLRSPAPGQPAGAVFVPTGLCEKREFRPATCQAQYGRGLLRRHRLGGGLDLGGAREPSRQRRQSRCRRDGFRSEGMPRAPLPLSGGLVASWSVRRVGSALVTSADRSAPDPGRVAVIIPTYNERDNIASITARLRAAVPAADVLIADDSSPDGTGEVADKLAADDPHIQVLHRPAKAGLGAAYLAGFRWALDAGYDAIVEMDADGSHDPADLPRMLAALRDADLVIGSRWIPGGTVRNWPKSRELLSRGANSYARLMLAIPLHDATAGYRAYRAETLRKIDLDDVQSQGYCFQIDLALRTIRAGLTVTEVPITFTDRAQGASKMSRSIVIEAFWRVALWGISAWLRRLRRANS
jgi:dolichol-phosphate mannosyltransferase